MRIPSSFGCSQPRASGAAVQGGGAGQRWPFQAQALAGRAAELKESGGQVRPPPARAGMVLQRPCREPRRASPSFPPAALIGASLSAVAMATLAWCPGPAGQARLLRPEQTRSSGRSLQKVDPGGLLRGRKGHGVETAPRAGRGPPGVTLVVEILGLVGPCYCGGLAHTVFLLLYLKSLLRVIARGL